MCRALPRRRSCGNTCRALLPPLVAFGLLVGGGEGVLALRALLFLLTNVICVNLAAVVTFVAQGIHPVRWREADRAKKATRIAIGLWTLLLATLGGTILLVRKLWN